MTNPNEENLQLSTEQGYAAMPVEEIIPQQAVQEQARQQAAQSNTPDIGGIIGDVGSIATDFIIPIESPNPETSNFFDSAGEVLSDIAGNVTQGLGELAENTGELFGNVGEVVGGLLDGL